MQRAAAIASTSGLCTYCGLAKKLEMDHVDPLIHGGEHDVDNIVPACKSCNASKHDRPLIQWLVLRKYVA